MVHFGNGDKLNTVCSDIVATTHVLHQSSFLWVEQ